MTHPRLTRVAQAVAATVMLIAATIKFMGDPGGVEVFVRLGMEPTGRYLIALVELAAALLLVSPYAALGSLIAVSVMLGATLAHLTQLGLQVHGDGGVMAGLLIVNLLCSGFVLVSRRRELPLLGDSLSPTRSV